MITLFFHILKQSYVNKQINKKEEEATHYNKYKKKSTTSYITKKEDIYRLMQIIVIYFLYHIRPKKAIAQLITKKKSADRTNVLVFDWQYCCNSKR